MRNSAKLYVEYFLRKKGGDAAFISFDVRHEHLHMSRHVLASTQVQNFPPVDVCASSLAREEAERDRPNAYFSPGYETFSPPH